MHIPILIEPGLGGGFRARAGEPFGMSADGQTEQEAAAHLAALLQDRLKAGARLAFIELANGSQVLPLASLHFDAVPEDDWFFQTMRQAIDENRQRDDEANG